MVIQPLLRQTDLMLAGDLIQHGLMFRGGLLGEVVFPALTEGGSNVWH